jgi:hypothetical protein
MRDIKFKVAGSVHDIEHKCHVICPFGCSFSQLDQYVIKHECDSRCAAFHIDKGLLDAEPPIARCMVSNFIIGSIHKEASNE